MSGTIGALHGIPAPASRWDGDAAARLSVLDALAYRSRLLGADRALANIGGGNTSAKESTVDHTGRESRALGEGVGHRSRHDLGRRLRGVAARRALAAPRTGCSGRRGDGRYLRASAVQPDQPRPSIETLLHAFIPAPHVDHTHPDAVIALTSNPDGRKLAERAFGDEIVWLDYQRPGFDMSRRIAMLLDQKPSARAVLLEKHGLVTWGETGEESYGSTIEFVSRAAHAIDEAAKGRFGLGGRQAAELEDGAAASLLSQSLPALRGALLADADGLVLELDRSTEAVAFASAARAREVSQVGAPCPDHLINTKHKPLVVEFDPVADGPAELAAAFRAGVDEYARWYRGYYDRNVDDETRPFPIDPAGPRVVLVPGVGIVTSGRRRRPGADLARPVSPGDRGRGRCRRARRLPLALARARRLRSSTGRWSATSSRRRRLAESSPGAWR